VGWRLHWTLDGLKATITNTSKGMDFYAAPTVEDSSHAVLWTNQSFAGDVRIEYEYTRLDSATRFVTILYVQATGSGVGPYLEDISEWASLRTVPAMRTYFNNVNLYHISYAAHDNQNTNADADYIRARRYLPEANKGLEGTALEPDFFGTGLFRTGVPHKITVIKKGQELFMHIRNEKKDLLCHWQNQSLPPITEGPIGLRHMHTRKARYRDFRVSIRMSKANPKLNRVSTSPEIASANTARNNRFWEPF
jgi:hypothetical protein